MKSKIFVIAEAGSNWKAGTAKQDLRRAFDLIDGAKSAGADAVKFQTYRADTVYVSNAGSSDYLSKNGIRRSITDIFRELEMPYSMIPKIAAYAAKKGIHFMSSAFSVEDFAAVDPYVRIHKIASYEITHPRLIQAAARCRKPLILSTGAATLDDIDWALHVFRRAGGRKVSLMQCTAKYPAPFSSLNLAAIPALIRRYRVPVGLSDHSLDPVTAPVAAVALGATLIEKHFTLDRKLKGPDHAFAVTVPELGALVRAVRGCEASLGSGRKEVLPEERELLAYAQRAVQATRDIAKGEELQEGVNVAVLRPGKQKKGAHPRHLARMEGRRASRFIAAGSGVGEKDHG